MVHDPGDYRTDHLGLHRLLLSLLKIWVSQRRSLEETRCFEGCIVLINSVTAHPIAEAIFGLQDNVNICRNPSKRSAWYL